VCDAASAAAVHSFKRSVAINSSSLNDMLRVATVIQQITELSGAELEHNSDHYSKCRN
jgi:methyl coenzyme M reductase beta subunit